MSLPRLLYTAPEVAEALGVSAYWLCEQARSGQIPAKKMAGAWRWTRAQIDALAEQDASPELRQTGSTVRRTRRAQSSAETTSVVQLVARPPRRRRSD